MTKIISTYSNNQVKVVDFGDKYEYRYYQYDFDGNCTAKADTIEGLFDVKKFKKELQKIAKECRTERAADGNHTRYECEYPKAMLTGQQEAKRTATINCDRLTFNEVQSLAETYREKMAIHLVIENTKYACRDGFQLRINF